MHNALLPVTEHFAPKQNAWNPQLRLLRNWKQFFRRKSKNSLAKLAVMLLLFILIVVKTTIVPYRRLPAQNWYAPTNSDFTGIAHIDSDKILNDWGPQVAVYDYSKQTTTSITASQKNEYLIILIPLRNAESVLDTMFDLLHKLTYPHFLIDLAFLVSDSTDDTYAKLHKGVSKVKTWAMEKRFNRIDIYKYNFGAKIGQGVDQRHNVAVQAERRKLMGRARNWLLYTALKPYHSWVYWRDADIESSPDTIIEDLMFHDADVIVPNVWRPLPKWLGGQQPYDLNSWVESDMALELAQSLDEDDVIVEGYAEYPTWRVHLAYLRNEDGEGDPYEAVELDGIGGVSILAKARIFRSGANFPGFSFLNHVETEGFGKMCKKMGFSVIGLTQYTVWHKYEPSEEDIIKMREMEAEGLPID